MIFPTLHGELSYTELTVWLKQGSRLLFHDLDSPVLNLASSTVVFKQHDVTVWINPFLFSIDSNFVSK